MFLLSVVIICALDEVTWNLNLPNSSVENKMSRGSTFPVNILPHFALNWNDSCGVLVNNSIS